jgi:hypothetical protein
MQAEVHNTSSRERSVGVLMLVDTKIGDNDRAPIITSFGYRARETEYRRTVAPGMPEFWLGLEGTPTDPGLTARGNLRASGLIEPDYVLMGNWKDNTAVPGAIGLASALWKERTAFDVEYTDSAVLMLWDEQTMAPGERRLRAATEIGIVDSLDVSRPVPGVDEIWLAGAGLASSCLGFDVVREQPCGAPGYSPYAPDSLQALYLVTNRGTRDVDDLRIVIPSVPAGLGVGVRSTPVVPSSVKRDSTGVATVSITPLPRLTSKTFGVPLAVVARSGDTLHRDTICVTVPGLLGELEVEPAKLLPLCPGQSDTIDVRVHLDGPRCLALAPDAMLVGSSPDIDRFEIVAPLPTTIPSDGVVTYRVRYTAGPVGVRHRVGLAVYAEERGLNERDRDTTVIIGDTATIEGEGKEAEFQFANPTDTLDLGAICVGDIASGDWTISNIGGCSLTIDRDWTFENDPRGQFGVADDARFPMTIGRDGDSLVTVRFAPTVAGDANARFIIRGSAAPFVDTLIVRGRGDVPRLDVTEPQPLDTVCPGERIDLAIPVANPTACDVTITSVTVEDSRFSVDATAPITLTPRSQRRLHVTADIDVPGRYATRVRVTGSDGSEHLVDVDVVVASRSLSHDGAIAFGDVRLEGAAVTRRITITSNGSAEATVSALRIVGANAGEFTLALPNGESLPLVLAAGALLDVDVTFVPADLEARRARLIVETGARGVCVASGPIELTGRGVMPLLDVPKRRMVLGRRCAGAPIDTTIELRNVGNAPLTVSGVAGSDGIVSVEGLPVVIAADSVRTVRVIVTPDRLGAMTSTITFAHDGRWFTAPDTLVEIVGTTVLCGTLSADTVRGRVGSHVKVPVRISAPGLTPADIARMLNEIGASGIELTLGHDSRIARFTGELQPDGMLTELTTPAVVTPAPSSVRVTSDDNAGALGASPIIATLDAEILLGASDRTVLDLAVARFASGYADLAVHDGLILAEYCALDARYVSVNGPLIAATSTPLPPGGALVVRLPEPAHATVVLHDDLGRAVATLHDDVIDGTRAFRLDGVDSGVYTAVVRTSGGSATARIVVVR